MIVINDRRHELPMTIYRWHIAFWKHQKRRYWFQRLFARGPYFHVSALGYSARCNMWVLYAPDTNGTRIKLLHNDDSFLALLDVHRKHADMLTVTAAGDERPRHTIWRPGHYCVPAIIRLLGVRSGALTPGGLYSDLVAMGAKPSFED